MSLLVSTGAPLTLGFITCGTRVQFLPLFCLVVNAIYSWHFRSLLSRLSHQGHLSSFMYLGRQTSMYSPDCMKVGIPKAGVNLYLSLFGHGGTSLYPNTGEEEAEAGDWLHVQGKSLWRILGQLGPQKGTVSKFTQYK